MKNKIDPRQYTPYALNVPSGNIHTDQGVDFFNVILLESLTGDFTVTGSLGLNGGSVYTPNSSNNVTTDDRSHMFNGINNVVGGIDNTIVSSSNSTITGKNNTIVGGVSNDVSGDYSTAIGSYINILHTGAMVLKDSLFTIGEDMGDDTLAMYFNGGIFLQNQTYLDDALWITGGELFISGHDIVANNNLDVGGTGTFSGVARFLGDMRDSNDSLIHSIEENITGEIQMENDILMSSGDRIKASGYNNFFTLHTFAPELEHHSSGVFRSSLNLRINDIDSGRDYHNTGDNDAYFRENSLSVENGNDELCGAITDSGELFVKEYIQLGSGVTVPTHYNSTGRRR